jgi:hypothetical protein
MYVIAVAGSVFGLLWPWIVKAWRANAPKPRYYVLGQDSKLPQYLFWFGLTLFIAGALVALGFAAFLGDEANQEQLEASGTVAYFLSFTFGFGTAALVEEPLRKG